jgi:hypothetical protein
MSALRRGLKDHAEIGVGDLTADHGGGRQDR